MIKRYAGNNTQHLHQGLVQLKSDAWRKLCSKCAEEVEAWTPGAKKIAGYTVSAYYLGARRSNNFRQAGTLQCKAFGKTCGSEQCSYTTLGFWPIPDIVF